MLKSEPIMLIEDNEEYASDILGILGSLYEKNKWLHLQTGRDALEYFENNTILPQLIILGFNCENPESIDFVKKIKTNKNLRKIPVVIMASSNDGKYVLECFNLGVAGYIVKSKETSELANIINTIMNYWNLCELPPL
jgi:DNA-binding NarL/FixJ family response regulator